MAESNGKTNPNVGGTGGGGAGAPVMPPQGTYTGADIAGSTVEGGRFPFSQADAAHANPLRKQEIGVGTIGNPTRPFKVS